MSNSRETRGSGLFACLVSRKIYVQGLKNVRSEESRTLFSQRTRYVATFSLVASQARLVLLIRASRLSFSFDIAEIYRKESAT